MIQFGDTDHQYRQFDTSKQYLLVYLEINKLSSKGRFFEIFFQLLFIWSALWKASSGLHVILAKKYLFCKEVYFACVKLYYMSVCISCVMMSCFDCAQIEKHTSMGIFFMKQKHKEMCRLYQQC
jgi:hypothetical protein